jgi:hypothetical protein
MSLFYYFLNIVYRLIAPSSLTPIRTYLLSYIFIPIYFLDTFT